MRSSDKALRSLQFSSSELGENRVTSDMPRAHTPIYVFVRFCVHILMCSRTNTSTHSHIYIQICFYVLIHICSYAFITVKIWPYNFIFLYRYALWSLLFSLQVCHIHSENRVTYSISDPRGVSPDCKMCVRERNEDDTYHVILSQMSFWNANNHSTQYLISRFWLADHRRIKILVPTYVCDKLDRQQCWCYADRK